MTSCWHVWPILLFKNKQTRPLLTQVHYALYTTPVKHTHFKNVMLRLSLQPVNTPKFPVNTTGSQRLAEIILATGQGNMHPDTIYFSFLIWTFPCFTCQPTLPVLMYICLVVKKTLRSLSCYHPAGLFIYLPVHPF